MRFIDKVNEITVRPVKDIHIHIAFYSRNRPLVSVLPKLPLRVFVRFVAQFAQPQRIFVKVAFYKFGVRFYIGIDDRLAFVMLFQLPQTFKQLFLYLFGIVFTQPVAVRSLKVNNGR